MKGKRMGPDMWCVVSLSFKFKLRRSKIGEGKKNR